MGYNRSGHTRTKREKRRKKHLKRLAEKAEKKVMVEGNAPAPK